MTSFGVIAQVRKKLNIKKIGHLGTLDPAGVGILPLAVNKATKLFDVMQKKVKTYRAIFVFGKQTTTLDSQGEVEFVDSDCDIKEEQLLKMIPSFIGEQMQQPPQFSAKKINGKRAYDLARQGENFELQPKKIIIYSFELISQIAKNAFLFEIKCSTGTYIRSLCRDVAEKLGTYAYMPLIIRTQVGCFTLDNAVDLYSFLQSENPNEFVIGFDKVYPLEKINLTEENSKKLKNGLVIDFNSNDGEYYLCFNDKIFAIGKINKGKLKMEIYLND